MPNNTLSDFNAEYSFSKNECCNKSLTNIKIFDKSHKINHN